MKHVTDRSVYLRWLIPASSFRLPVALLPLAIEYVIGSAAGFRFASLVVGAVAVGEISVVGILATRRGQRAASLGAQSTLTILALLDIALLLASLIHPLLAFSLPVALLSGATTALASGKLRQVLTAQLSPQSLQRYLSWDAVALEIAYLVAPALIAVQVMLAGARLLLVIPAVLAALSPVLLRRHSTPTLPTAAIPHITLRSWLWVLSAGEGLGEGMVVVTIVPIATELLHNTPFGALAMALLSLGSILGGSLYAHFGTGSAAVFPQRRIAILLIGLSICLVAEAAGIQNELLVGVTLLCFGGFVAPSNGLRTFAATHHFDRRLHSSAFSMIYSSYSIGSVTAAVAFAVLDQTLALSAILILAALGTATVSVAYLSTYRTRPDSATGGVKG